MSSIDPATMSNRIYVEEATFGELKGKVVVLTGGANGIGLEAIKYLVAAGAHVIFGDYDTKAGEAAVDLFQNAANKPTFVPIDVSKYEDNLRLFKTALQKYGRVDHAVANAGILERGAWFDPSLTVESVEKSETTAVVDINYVGVLYFTRIAAVYLRHNRQPGEDKSITLISSAAGFRDSPGLFLYQSSKFAVIGLLRSTRKTLHERDNIRINAICPAITDSAMTVTIIDSFRATKQAINTTQDVAKYIVGLQVRSDLAGKAVYVEGGRGWEFLEGMDASMDAWLGEEPTRRIREHLAHVGQGAGWKVK